CFISTRTSCRNSRVLATVPVTFFVSSEPAPPCDSSPLIFTARVAINPHSHALSGRFPNSGRGGGIRTPIPGFGDRSPNRWPTPLRSKPACPSPLQNDSCENFPCKNEPLLHFLVRRLPAASVAELLRFQPLGMLLLVFRRCVIAVLAIPALQRDDLAHRLILSRSARYSMISVTAPAPTVCPPSRMANRKTFSSATGVISDTSQLTLSPGINISTPCGSVTFSVTSVVRKQNCGRYPVKNGVCRPPSSLVSTYASALNLVCGVIDPGLHTTCPRSTSSFSVPRSNSPTLSPAKPSSSSLRNISTPVTTFFCVGRKPTISISSPTFTLPRSTRPVTTVPRPEIEKISSIGIANGLSISRTGCGTFLSTASIKSSIDFSHLASPFKA